MLYDVKTMLGMDTPVTLNGGDGKGGRYTWSKHPDIRRKHSSNKFLFFPYCYDCSYSGNLKD